MPVSSYVLAPPRSVPAVLDLAGGFGGIATRVGLFWLLNRILERFFPAKRKRYAAAMGNALLGAGAVFEPSREPIVEVRKQQPADQDDTGEPPGTGGRH